MARYIRYVGARNWPAISPRSCKTDKHAAYPIERPVSAGDMVATIYRLLGIDPAMTVNDLSGKPVPIAHGGEPVEEVIA